MRDTIYPMTGRIGGAVLTVVLATCSTMALAQATPYFAASLEAFDTIRHDTGGNHPDHYAAKCNGTLLTTDYVGIYGTTRIHDVLNKVSGEIDVTSSMSGPGGPTERKLLPPDQGGDYFEYGDALVSMQRALEMVEAGAALDFIKAAQDEVKALTTIDAIRLLTGGGVSILGRTTSLRLAYKAQAGRSLLVAVCDSTGCYGEKKAELTVGDGVQSFDLMVPQQLADEASASIRVRLMAQGQNTALKELSQPLRLEKYEKVNAYVAYSLNAGTHDNAYILYRSAAPSVTIALKIFDAAGQLVAAAEGQAAGTTDPYTRSFNLSFDLAAAAATGAGKVVVRVYGEGGSWDNFLSESVSSSTIATRE